MLGSKEGKLGEDAEVMTVAGARPAADLGFVLPHEHVLVDFIGADKISPDRYEQEDVIRVVTPYLNQAKSLGCETLVECTPDFLGRDPVLLKRLTEITGLHFLTNTGFYGAAKDKFIPAHAYEASVDQLADAWTREWEEGIDKSEVRPGFMKIGVDNGPLSDIDKKLVRAAARTHLKTGLTIAVHTGPGLPAMEELAVLAEEGVHPSAWIWVHAQSEKDTEYHVRAAEQGAWIEFDGVGPNTLDRHVELVVEMKRHGHLDQVLISHDAGWFRPGEPDGGAFRGFDTVFNQFLPALKKKGLTDIEVDRLTHLNPQRAYTIGIRALN